MKKFINQHQKIKSIGRILDKYPAAFANKLKAQAMIADYNQNCDDLSELISQLLRPASTIHRPKQDSQQKLVTALSEFLGMGILLASHLDNKPLLDILKVYKAKMNNVSAYKLFEMADHVAEELEKRSDLALGFGISTENMLAFKGLVTDFGIVLENTGVLLTIRRSGWNDLRNKLNTCSKMIRHQIDPFIIFNEKEFPELYKDYMLIRGSRKRRKRPTMDEDPSAGEISGVVTDCITHLPLANATINILNHESSYTTDADGYYLVEELGAGSFTISCYAPGYVVPEQVTSPIAEGESLIIDFALVPAIKPPGN